MGGRRWRDLASYLVCACLAVAALTGCRSGPEDTHGQDSHAKPADANGATPNNLAPGELQNGPIRVESAALDAGTLLAPAWSAAGAMHVARQNHIAALLSSGQVLVAGGHPGNLTSTATAETYNPSTNVWTTVGSMATARRSFGACTLASGKVLVAGGNASLGDVATAELFNPSTNTWSTTGSMATAREDFSTTCLSDGRVLVAGGSGSSGILTSAEVYNPTAGTWSSAGTIPFAVHTQGAVLLTDGRVLIAGGNNASGPISQAAIWNPSTNAWTATASMSTTRAWFALNLLADGRVLAAAGLVNVGLATTRTAEIYTPSSGTWSAAASLTTSRYSGASATVAAGPMVISGVNGGAPLTSYELYDAVHNTWSQGTLTYGSVNQTATALTPTSVLVTGGNTGSNATTSTERYGVCSNAAAHNGTACDSGNKCTTNDSCQSGVCTPGPAVVCTASDTCHTAGTCSPSTGVCSNPVAANGTSCSDGNACTQTDTCQSGTCTGSNPVTCTASDQCHTAGTCNTSTGACSNPAATNGTACSDGNACTQTDTCQSGTCTGANPVTCTASDQCHAAGTCNTSTGACSNPVATDGTACNDGNACTQTDTCQSGTCSGANPVTCTASDQCHTAGTCNTSTGACSNPVATDGTACSDGNACTQTDACQGGTCAGSNPVTCTASDQCHTAGACDPSSGTCSNPAVADGTGCNDGNACTQTDACQGGTCTGSNPVVCTASDSCHLVGTCDATSGTCSNPTAADGTSCSTGATCTTENTCLSGACQPGTPVTIDDGNACTLDTCDATHGVVHHACSTLDRTVSTTLFNADSFLFSGTAPVQTGVAAGTIVPATMAVVRGQVLNRAASPLSGATVTVVNHPEFGSTLSQGDGTFDMAVNGGQTLRLHYSLDSYLPAERLVEAPWQDYVSAADVVLVQLDPQVTPIDLSSSSDVQVARGTPSTDSAGTRQATLIVSPDTQATMTMPDGSTTPLGAMHVRATEYSVGTNGPSAMPASLPPTSAYAYAVELSADEAASAGATKVAFSQPLAFYVENFLGFPVGTSIPSGSYNPTLGAWMPSANGLVLQILSATGGSASLDVNGDGTADTGSALAALGITSAEQQELASLYSAGQTLWRVPVVHFTGYALGPDNGPPPGGPDDACDQSTCTDGSGNDIPCQVGVFTQQCRPTGDGCGNTNFCQQHGFPLTEAGCDQGGSDQTCDYFCCPAHYSPVLLVSLDLGSAVCEAGGGGNASCNSPPPPPPQDGNGPGNCTTPNASTIECQRQSLGEDLSIAGTPYALHYESDRQRGRQATLTIPLSGPSLKSTVTGISMQVSLAGRLFTQSFAAQANQSTTFTWDGKDAYGRFLQGAQPVTVEMSNVYSGVYENSSAFGVVGTGARVASSATRQPFSLTEGWAGTIERWDSLPQGLGGWTLNVHHTFDRSGGKLRLGDGTNRTPTDLPAVIQTVAGNGQSASNGDGGLATLASVSSPQSVAIGPDGSVYIAAAQSCIRKVGPDGHIATFAGQCNSPGFSGDGGAATSAQLQSPEDIAFGPDGSVFIADSGNQRIRRIDPEGVIRTVAGTGGVGFLGDGGPAIGATFQSPSGVDVAPDGTFYIADSLNYCVRSVSPDGIIRTVAGNHSSTPANLNGDEGPATATSLGLPMKVRVGGEGSLYIAESSGNEVRRVGPDGIIRAFAGLGDSGGGGYGGDGGPATNASLKSPADIALGADGTVYIVDGNQTVRAVSSRGTISTVAGVAGGSTFSGDNGPAAAATMGNSLGVRAAPDGSIYIACSADNRVRRIQPALPGFSTAAFQVPSEDGRQIYVFDGNDRHQQTLDAVTGAALYQFSYDGSGRLVALMDVDGNVTQINRDSSGNLTSIVGPFGEQMTFAADANGYLATAVDPAGQQTVFSYDANGLMQTKSDPRGQQSQYTYDSLGRLSKDEDPAGGARTLSRTASTTGFGVSSITSLGRSTTYQTTSSATGAFSRQNTLPNTLQSALQFALTATTSVKSPDGTTTTKTDLPDPRPGFGMLSSVPSVVTKTPAGLTSTQTTTRSVTFAGSNLATLTEQTNLNGNAWARLFNAGTSTWTTTSPAGRVSTMIVDSAERPIQIAVANVAPIDFAYDAHGRLSTTTQGTRTWTQGYDAQGYLASVTDPLNHAISYINDPVGRPTQTMLPDARLLGTAYDGDSNTTQITLPSGELHDFTFTPVDQLASYVPPSVSSGSPTTQYVYDLDRELKTVTRPDAVTLTYAYDGAGRLHTTTIPQGTVTLAYNPSTGNLQSSTAPSGEAIAYTFDGFLKTGETWSGPVPGTLSLGFDNNFRVTSQTVNGTALGFGYDLDGLLTGAGALTLTRDPQNGRLTGTTLGSVTDSYGYDSNGLFASYTAAFNGTTLYAESVLRDAVGRITQKTETVQGTTHVWGYTFDLAGRLTDVTEDRNFFSHYGYDNDDNRTTYTNTSGTVSPTYDAQDRLTAYGSATYGYTLNGDLSSKTVSGQTTSYTYDPLGNLLHVGPPTGSAIDYVVDGENRRVGKKLGGTLTTGFLYQDGLNVVAQLDGTGNLVARYVFGSKPNAPDYFTTSAGTFRVLSDHLGSPRLIVNTSSGAVVEEIDYDEFGNVTNDTSPGLTPFGFAGGLYDKDTGLVRFGARDYDASVGRWTGKDPQRFDGGSLNLYGYVLNDPIDWMDPNGMDGDGAPNTSGGDPTGGQCRPEWQCAYAGVVNTGMGVRCGYDCTNGINLKCVTRVQVLGIICPPGKLIEGLINDAGVVDPYNYKDGPCKGSK